jgi:hypothetical protein
MSFCVFCPFCASCGESSSAATRDSLGNPGDFPEALKYRGLSGRQAQSWGFFSLNAEFFHFQSKLQQNQSGYNL